MNSGSKPPSDAEMPSFQPPNDASMNGAVPAGSGEPSGMAGPALPGARSRDGVYSGDYQAGGAGAGPVSSYPPPAYPAPAYPGSQALRPAWLPPALPVVDSTYHDFWRTPRWRALNAVLVLVIVPIAWVVISGFVMLPALWIDGGGQFSLDVLTMTPALFIANNIALAVFIPISLAACTWIFGQPARWLHSVVGRVRWGWMGTCFAVLAVLWLIFYGVSFLLNPHIFDEFQLQPYTWVMIVGILLTTPWQAAGEEYGMRGAIARAATSFIRPDKLIFGKVPAGFVLGTVVSSLLFMLAHVAADPWLNLFYFSFGVIACVLAWRTGGLEAGIAMHVINNLFAESTLPFTDISLVFDRQAGVGDPTVLLNILFPLIGMGIVLHLAKKKGLVTKSAPGARPVLASPSASAGTDGPIQR